MCASLRCPTKPGTPLNRFCVPTAAQTGQHRSPASLAFSCRFTSAAMAFFCVPVRTLLFPAGACLRTSSGVGSALGADEVPAELLLLLP